KEMASRAHGAMPVTSLNVQGQIDGLHPQVLHFRYTATRRSAEASPKSQPELQRCMSSDLP
ncbi:hypothetical protein, partial [Dyella sp.]|uniref:hypothetical protein n=1 Tax=Dyella sp. TaxID=1869338 RepID=UPI002B4782EB